MVAGAGPGTVISGRLDSAFPSAVQTAPCVSQARSAGKGDGHVGVGVRLDPDPPQVAAPVHPPGGGHRSTSHLQCMVPDHRVAGGDGLAEGDAEGEGVRTVMTLRRLLDSAVSGGAGLLEGGAAARVTVTV